MKYKFNYAKRPLLAALLSLQILSLWCLALTGPAQAAVLINPDWYYLKVWERTDWPVALGAIARSWYWGPTPFASYYEGYTEAPQNLRKVQYWDKSRMEITRPGVNIGSKWYVTNGLLVREMVSGYTQTGDSPDDNIYRSPSTQAVSGDPADYNQISPTYASFKNLASLAMDNRADHASGPVTARLAKDGTVSRDYSLGNLYPETSIAYYDNTLGHNIPAPLWQFMNLSGAVMVDRKLTTQTVEDWLFAFGFPISEAYWTRSVVGGVEKDVLVQLFERRALTYTPSNQGGFKVEMGNVGRHYFQWRYGSNAPEAMPAANQPPTRLVIPKLNINTPIEYVGVQPNNDMDTPADPNHVGWYKYGTQPGQPGNAVIDGHRDYAGYGPVVFYNLDRLVPGDQVYVVTSTGQRQTFQVIQKESISASSNLGEKIFGPSSNANLNLITCIGTFNSSTGRYADRLVVYTRLVS